MNTPPPGDEVGAADLEEMRYWLADCAEFGHPDPDHTFEHDIDPELLEDHEVLAQVERAYVGKQGTNGVAGFIADGIKPADRAAAEDDTDADAALTGCYQQADLLQLLDQDGHDQALRADGAEW